MTLDIVRRFVNGAWKTEAAETGGGAVGCTLRRSALNIHDSANYPISFDALVDNLWNTNPLAAIPDGLGLSFSFDGSSPDFLTTEDGVWSFSLFARGNSDDATWKGDTQIPFIEVSSHFDFVGSQYGSVLSSTFSMPAGTGVDQCVISTNTDATHDPFAVTLDLIIVRLG
jgi:hypothetical protein